MLINKFFLQDSRNLSKIVKNKVDVTITSPPYWDMKDYGFKGQIGRGQSYEEFIKDLTNVFKKCYALTKKSGSLWIVIDTIKKDGEIIPLPFDLNKAFEKEKIGWKLQDIIIWQKDKMLPWSHKGKMRKIFEYILFYTKIDNFKYFINRIKNPNDIRDYWIKYPERYNPQGKTPAEIWNIPILTQGSWSTHEIRHFCPFPPELVERILLLTTNKNDLVLDPFAGIGSVLAQAYVMRRNYIGFDRNKQYKKIFYQKVLPYFRNRWQVRVKELQKLYRKQRILKSKIQRLKWLKYPKTLSEKLYKNDVKEINRLHTIFVLKNPYKEIEICLVFNQKINKQNMLDKIHKACFRPPLSKFGFNPKIKILSVTEFKNSKIVDAFKKKPLFLYAKGKINCYEKVLYNAEWEVNNKNWERYFYKSIPPIVSNIKIYHSKNLILTP